MIIIIIKWKNLRLRSRPTTIRSIPSHQQWLTLTFPRLLMPNTDSMLKMCCGDVCKWWQTQYTKKNDSLCMYVERISASYFTRASVSEWESPNLFFHLFLLHIARISHPSSARLAFVSPRTTQQRTAPNKYRIQRCNRVDAWLKYYYRGKRTNDQT